MLPGQSPGGRRPPTGLDGLHPGVIVVLPGTVAAVRVGGTGHRSGAPPKRAAGACARRGSNLFPAPSRMRAPPYPRSLPDGIGRRRAFWAMAAEARRPVRRLANTFMSKDRRDAHYFCFCSAYLHRDARSKSSKCSGLTEAKRIRPFVSRSVQYSPSSRMLASPCTCSRIAP